jgi:4-amino-4-deoxy-L-arabinose transferase-like glycosyltransferase
MILIYFPIFMHLETLPVRIYDEARLAINAWEIYINGNFIVTYTLDEPDMWNTKPPLLIWLQVAGTYLFGPGELALRLPSAIATLLLCILILVLSEKYLKSFWFGVFAVLILVTSNGFIHIHASRTGDYDALLTLFMTLYCLSFFGYIETGKNKFLYAFYILLTLGVLTKSVQALLFLPGLFLYALLRRAIPSLLKNRHLYFGAIILLVTIAVYYLLRESLNPGYLKAVAENELGGRYLETLEDHHESFWFYFDNLRLHHFREWMWLLIPGTVTGLLVRKKEVNRLTLFSILLVITYFLLISFGQTKLYWYEVPMYPFMVLICSNFVYYAFTFIKEKLRFRKKWINPVILTILVVALYYEPARKIIIKTYHPQVFPWETEEYEIEYFIRDALRGKYDLRNHFIAHDTYHLHLLFYANLLNEKGENVQFKHWESLQPGDRVVAHQPNVKDYIENNYLFEEIYTRENVKIYKIDGTKQDN